jgi:hypothetical protein
MSFTIPNYANATTYPEQSRPDSLDFSFLASGTAGVGVISGCAVDAQSTPDMTLAVGAGMVRTGAGVQITVSAGNVTVTTAHASLARWDLVVVSSAGAKSVVAGTANSTPQLPDPGTAVAICAILVPPTVTAITNTMLVDKRVTQASAFSLVTGLIENDSAAATANTTAIQNALTAAAAAGSSRSGLATGGPSTGGTRVVLPAGRYYINRGSVDTTCCLSIGNAVVLVGQGLGTQLILANGVATAASPCTMLKAAGTTNFIGIEDITLLGNKSNQTDTNNGSHGVNLGRSGISELYDGLFWLKNVFVYEAAGGGFFLWGVANTLKVIGCHAYHCQTDGFYGKTDQCFVACVSGNNSGIGFHWYAGTSNFGIGLKAFGNQIDYYIEYCDGFWFAGCQSEDFNSSAGFALTSAYMITLISCGVYRKDAANGTSNTTGFLVQDDGIGNLSHHIVIDGTVHGITGTASSQPHYALTTRNIGESITVRLKTSTVQTGKYRSISGTAIENAFIRFDNQDGNQTIAYAASVTPDQYKGQVAIVGTLTGAITINNPVEPYVGQQILFVLTQDATGGRVVTWGSAFQIAWAAHIGPSKVSMMQFIYTGSFWQQVEPGHVQPATQTLAASTTVNAATLSPNATVRLATSATANTTLTISNPTNGQVITFEWTITSGSQTYANPTGGKYAAAAAWTHSTTAGRKDIVTFGYDGTNWLERSRSINVG